MTDYATLMQEIEQLDVVEGISTVTLLDLPDHIAPVLRKITRQKSMELAEFATELELPDEQAASIGDLLTEKGYLVTEHQQGSDATVYCVYFARMRKRNLPLDF